ncbi:phosphocarrier protein HPr [Alphaproteobacteria bacterium]|nr:phosphocarrier protein HPr [Alphaproteobacteria bacterium]
MFQLVPRHARKTVVIANAKGLHARAAGELAKVAEGLDAEFIVRKISTGTEVDGRSILDLMMLAAGRGTELELRAKGRDARRLVRRAARLVEGLFNEGQ